MDFVSKFLKQYQREVDYYEKAAKICAQICEEEIERAGIRAIVSYRVKRADRLRDKLIKRNEKKQYENVDEIYRDIIDLAGVRIALYFPGDKEKVDQFIKNNFTVKKTKSFPEPKPEVQQKSGYQKVFSGYHATHYRLNLRRDRLQQENLKYANAVVEIQLASVLMHAWSEVEHDLVYKPLSGEISVDEYEILDELNGLILAGELALRRLQKAVKERLRQQEEGFSNHFELAAYIYDRISALGAPNSEDINMGRVDIFFKFLKYADLNKPEILENYLDMVEYGPDKLTVVEQTMENMVQKDTSLYRILVRVKGEMNSKNPYSNSDEVDENSQSRKMLFYFVDKWVDFQYVVRRYIKKYFPDMDDMGPLTQEVLESILKDKNMVDSFNSVRNINYELIHGNSQPSDEKLVLSGKMLESIIDSLLEQFEGEEKQEILDKINEIEVNID